MPRLSTTPRRARRQGRGPRARTTQCAAPARSHRAPSAAAAARRTAGGWSGPPRIHRHASRRRRNSAGTPRPRARARRRRSRAPAPRRSRQNADTRGVHSPAAPGRPARPLRAARPPRCAPPPRSRWRPALRSRAPAATAEVDVEFSTNLRQCRAADARDLAQRRQQDASLKRSLRSKAASTSPRSASSATYRM